MAASTSIPVDLPITLGQFIKLAGYAATGGDAKILVTSGRVRVNGHIEKRRGHRLAEGDVVQVGSHMGQVALVRAATPPTLGGQS